MAGSKGSDGSDELKKLPRFGSLDELVSFFDENDLGDYDLPEVEMKVNVKRPVGLEKELYQKLDELARARGISTEDLLNSWVREKIEGQPAPR